MQMIDQCDCEAGARAVAANRNMRSGNTLILQEPPSRQRILICGREWMFGRKSIGNSQRAHSSGATRLSHQATMTHDRTGTITATMKKHQDAGRIAALNDRPFTRYRTAINCSELHVCSDRPNRTHIIEAFP